MAEWARLWLIGVGNVVIISSIFLYLPRSVRQRSYTVLVAFFLLLVLFNTLVILGYPIWFSFPIATIGVCVVVIFGNLFLFKSRVENHKQPERVEESAPPRQISKSRPQPKETREEE